MNRFYKILTFLILLIIFTCVVTYNAVGTYSNDDWWAGFFCSNNFITNLISSDQGLVWSWNIEKIIVQSIPELLHWHPQQNILMPITKGINFAVYIALISMFFNAAKRKIPNPLVVLFNTLLCFYIVFLVDNQIFFQINQHMKYTFNLIIGGTIWFTWIREFLNNEFLTEKNIIRNCLFAVILVFAGHLVSIPTSILFAGMALYRIRHADNINEVISVTLAVILIFANCFIMYINMPGFTYIRLQRVPDGSVLWYSATHFIDFSKEFFKYIFSNKYIYGMLLLMFAGIFNMFVLRKNIDKKYFVIVISIFFANFFFQYLLLSCGRTNYDNVSYWFTSEQLTSTFIFYTILNCNIIYGSIFNAISKKNIKIILIILIFTVINAIYPLKTACKNVAKYHTKELVQREAIYKLSKICRYYALKGDIVYLPDEYLSLINILAYQDCFILFRDNFGTVYHVDIHTKPYIKTYKKITNQSALFSPEELSNINFNKLYDDNFILQMPKPEYK